MDCPGLGWEKQVKVNRETNEVRWSEDRYEPPEKAVKKEEAAEQ